MKELKQMMYFVWPYMKPYKKKVVPFMIFSVIYNIFTIVDALALGWLIDSMIYTQTVSAIVNCSVIFLGINLVSFAICYYIKVNGQRVIGLTGAECKKQLAKHIQNTSLNSSSKTGSKQFMQKLNNDASLLMVFTANMGLQIVGQCLIFVIAIIIIFQINPVCGIAALLELPLIYLLYRFFGSKLYNASRNTAESQSRYFVRLYELLTDIKGIKLNSLSEDVTERFSEAAEQNIKTQDKKTKLEFMYSFIQDNMDVLLKIFLFFYGGIAVINGKMTAGQFSILYAYYTTVTSAFAYFLDFGSSVQEHYAYYSRLKEITDVPEETNGSCMLEQIDEIEMKQVSFGYSQTNILKDFSQSFQRGKLYCIAGENGCGKSTMTMLLAGMYIDEYKGEITYNGQSIRTLDMKTLRRQKVGVCEQEPCLIADTVRYNMTYGQSADDARLQELAYQVSLDSFLQNAEYGLDSQVGENGKALSGGQKQKVALVKVFNKNPDLLILDEPTSAMDTEGKKRLLSFLQQQKKDKIILVITHDDEMLQAADEVVWMCPQA